MEYSKYVFLFNKSFNTYYGNFMDNESMLLVYNIKKKIIS